MIFKEEDYQNPGEYVGVTCGYTPCRLSAIMERFDEVDLSGRQVPSNDSIAPSGSSHDASSHDVKSHDAKSHDAKSHDTKSRDSKSHDPITSSATKHLPVGKPPSGKIDSHRVGGVFSVWSHVLL